MFCNLQLFKTFYYKLVLVITEMTLQFYVLIQSFDFWSFVFTEIIKHAAEINPQIGSWN